MFSFIIWVVGLSLFFKSPIPGAIAASIRQKHGLAGGGGAGATQELEQVRGELQEVRTEMMELAERLDFTERMLADVRRRGALQG